MKFGKRLRDLLEDSLPEWKNKFLAYKDLKKKLKGLTPADSPVQARVQDDPARREVTSEELFVRLLNEELEKFNNFFMEKEEEFVIRMQVLREETEKLKSRCPNGDLSRFEGSDAELNDVRKMVVSLHGEMVLLEHYSSLNYTGIVKILKKHDKRTGLLLRHPYISNVLRQPFLTTDILSRLVKECEQRLHSMFPSHSSTGSRAEDRNGDGSCLDNSGDRESSPDSPESSLRQTGETGNEDVEAIYRSALTALRSLQEIRGSSKTPHPLLAEVVQLPGVSFQKPDSESGAGKTATARPAVSASSTPGRRERDPEQRDVEPAGAAPVAGLDEEAPCSTSIDEGTTPEVQKKRSQTDTASGEETIAKRQRLSLDNAKCSDGIEGVPATYPGDAESGEAQGPGPRPRS